MRVATILRICRLWPSRTGLGAAGLHPGLLGGRRHVDLSWQSWPLEQEDDVALSGNKNFIYFLFSIGIYEKVHLTGVLNV